MTSGAGGSGGGCGNGSGYGSGGSLAKRTCENQVLKTHFKRLTAYFIIQCAPHKLTLRNCLPCCELQVLHTLSRWLSANFIMQIADDKRTLAETDTRR